MLTDIAKGEQRLHHALSYRFRSLSAAKVQLLFQLTIRYEEFTVILERFWPISGFKTWEDADHAEIKDLIKSRL